MNQSFPRFFFHFIIIIINKFTFFFFQPQLQTVKNDKQNYENKKIFVTKAKGKSNPGKNLIWLEKKLFRVFIYMS